MRDTPLPLLAVLGFVLVVLLFTADEALDKITQASIQTRVAAPAMATRATSEPVHAARPGTQVAPEHPMRIEPAPLAARAEASPAKKRVTRTHPAVEYRQNNASSRREFGLSGLR